MVIVNEINGRCQLGDFWKIFVFLIEAPLLPLLIYLFLLIMLVLYLREELSFAAMRTKLNASIAERER